MGCSLRRSLGRVNDALMHSGLAAQQRRRDLGKGHCHFLRAGPPAATQYGTGAHLGMARACHLIMERLRGADLPKLLQQLFRSVFFAYTRRVLQKQRNARRLTNGALVECCGQDQPFPVQGLY